jgi:hypothetical protein
MHGQEKIIYIQRCEVNDKQLKALHVEISRKSFYFYTCGHPYEELQ